MAWSPTSAFRPLILCAVPAMAVVAVLPALPPVYSGFLLLIAPVLAWRHPRARAMLLAAALGAIWALISAHGQLQHRLPDRYSGQEVVLQGRLIGLPDRDERRVRGVLAVTHIASSPTPAGTIPDAGHTLSWENVSLRRIRVSWYSEVTWQAGEYWQLRVRLKPPRGFVNPGGFDYGLWLMRQQVDATAYVRDGPENQRLSAPVWWSLSRWRERAKEWLLEHAPSSSVRWMQALLIGDRSGLSGADWARLESTGTHHLMAISGLHVGFIAGAGFLLGAVIGRLCLLLGLPWPASRWGHPVAFAAALCYSAMAGFSIPTQRALIMVLVVQWGLWQKRMARPWDVWLLALLLVLIRDPMAVLDTGFWLSFLAVAVLLLTFSGRLSTGRTWPGEGLWRSQWVVFIGLLVPLLITVHSVSVMAPLANLLAIPTVTFLVVPWLLLSALLAAVPGPLSDWLLTVAAVGLQGLEKWLYWLNQWRESALIYPSLSLPALWLTLLGSMLVLAPRGLPGRFVGYASLGLAVLLPSPPVAPLRITLLEVGQGLAVTVETPSHRLVYDTGPRYSESLDAGGGIIAPYWRRLGATDLDAVVVSHEHDDHAGGLPGLRAAMRVQQLWRGEPASDTAATNCHRATPWQWDKVHLRFLHGGFPAQANRNNRSCVLLIEYAGQTVLLTGDIEREVEWRLLASGTLPEQITVLQVPHHGATTSSSAEWVAHTRAEHAVVSAAFRGRHGHPVPEIRSRYQKQGSEWHNTALHGAVQFEWDRHGQLSVTRWRQDKPRWWY